MDAVAPHRSVFAPPVAHILCIKFNRAPPKISAFTFERSAQLDGAECTSTTRVAVSLPA